MNKIERYPEIIIYDFDGVIVNSNAVKSKVFFDVTKRFFGDIIADKFLSYHESNIHIDRYDKFKYLFSNILNISLDLVLYENLLSSFSVLLKKNMNNYEINDDIFKMRDHYKNSAFFIASGNNYHEILYFLKKKSLLKLFNGGVYGSPIKKIDNIQTILNKTKCSNVLFIGDTYDDFEISKVVGISFIFLSLWSNQNELQKFKNIKNTNIASSLIDVFKYY
jgi:phosphoglycolate phosphatase-like HAD superfamily hydrolase